MDALLRSQSKQSAQLATQDSKLDMLLQQKGEQDARTEAKQHKQYTIRQHEIMRDEVVFLQNRDESSNLGSGSFSCVYRVEYDGSPSASKVITLKGHDREQRQKMTRDFERELAIMCQLRHPNIVPVYGAVFGLEELWLIMDFAENGNLRTLLNTANLTIQDRLQFASDIALAFKYLHSRGVQHRDMKSPNILLFCENDQLRAKVTDFGLSRARSLLTSTATSTSNSLGSPAWSSPEYLRKEPFTDKSDVYSLGVVLWELLTLHQPWQDYDVMQIMMAVALQSKSLEVPAEDRVQSDLYELRKVVLWCLQSSPNNRPTAAQVAAALCSSE
jgi:serine/threonine-protein kinase CTR1